MPKTEPFGGIITIKDVTNGREWNAISQEVMRDISLQKQTMQMVALELDLLYDGLDSGHISQMELGTIVRELSRKLRGLD